ncbi:MAG TPA: HAMP domain-containing sensor histidine kinase [Acidimicrobiales bacterium]|nr:HAMP domain-containing sensor histidine kinase [Acidimicrobiales bacterium]
MTRRLVATYVTITAAVLLLLVIPFGVLFQHRERGELTLQVERDAESVSALVEDALQDGGPLPGTSVFDDFRERGRGRIIVADAEGRLVVDSAFPGVKGRDARRVVGVTRALDKQRTVGYADGEFFVALPVTSGGDLHGVVRVSEPTARRDARVRDAWWLLASLSAVVLAAVAAVGYLLARTVTTPVRAIERAAADVAGGNLAARAPTGRGVPEIRELARTFNATAARLDELVSSQRRFLADAAHQLRAPLTALRLRMESQSGDDSVEVAEVDRLTRIVDGLLALARAEAPPTTTPTNLAVAVASRVEAWRDVAAEQDVQIVAEVGAPVWASIDTDAVEQILDNLVANALAVAPAGSTVTVTIGREDDRAGLRVRDEGPGLDAATRERAFERFWRADTSRPGTGLGLAVVRQVARSCGGDAWLDAAPSGGIDAVVVVPLARVPSPGGRA